VRNKTEVAFSVSKLDAVLKSLLRDTILVGGQSLIFWVSYYKIDTLLQDGAPAISKDADILGDRSHVALIANAVGGIAKYPPKKAMTIIAGQVLLPLGEHEFLNIDVIHHVGTMDTDGVKRRAIEMDVEGHPFLVMHPIDVLISRAENFRSISDKQNAAGLRQVTLSINVAESYIAETAKRDEKIALKAIEKIAETARSPAGVFARKYGAEIYAAINPDKLFSLIKNKRFIADRLPRLAAEIAEVKLNGTGDVSI
jgi:hypothetical protein